MVKLLSPVAARRADVLLRVLRRLYCSNGISGIPASCRPVLEQKHREMLKDLTKGSRSKATASAEISRFERAALVKIDQRLDQIAARSTCARRGLQEDQRDFRQRDAAPGTIDEAQKKIESLTGRRREPARSCSGTSASRRFRARCSSKPW